MGDLPTSTNSSAPERKSPFFIAMLLVTTALLTWSIVAYFAHVNDLKDAQLAFRMTPQNVQIGGTYQHLMRTTSTYVTYMIVAGGFFVLSIIAWWISRRKKTA